MLTIRRPFDTYGRQKLSTKQRIEVNIDEKRRTILDGKHRVADGKHESVDAAVDAKLGEGNETRGLAHLAHEPDQAESEHAHDKPPIAARISTVSNSHLIGSCDSPPRRQQTPDETYIKDRVGNQHQDENMRDHDPRLDSNCPARNIVFYFHARIRVLELDEFGREREEDIDRKTIDDNNEYQEKLKPSFLGERVSVRIRDHDDSIERYED